MPQKFYIQVRATIDPWSIDVMPSIERVDGADVRVLVPQEAQPEAVASMLESIARWIREGHLLTFGREPEGNG